ncbi:flagellar L-ring protein precursor FlgH [Breoghania corrubedonensis]|uniref:Flagellar L-ring protein n=1 Tax=Breoghania corrubedonensis TaxID=665038 RepID=A0A2T5VDE6_9HYPH|nr:flagellar basal body L-ring protein FlgH [Breoghania corrubedonensis]PTW61778.1 flagellar L-ring protein precursor FlgH [Breoghania corrubedonensis]
MTPFRILLVSSACLLAAGCGTADKLKNIGKAPALSAINDPTATPGYRPVKMPMPHPEPVHYAANSLWQSGSRSFFKDQRARQVGDILTVVVTITDKAEIDNATERKRSGSDSMGAGGAVGTAIDKFLLPAGSSASDLADVSSTSSQSGSGTVDRSETLETKVAAVVTQVLPNGNLVIEGRQEVRVNFEVRELIVAGVIRPEDIGAENTIDSAKIAEARIAYGGRGQITDVQQPRYGSQALDILLPF